MVIKTAWYLSSSMSVVVLPPCLYWIASAPTMTMSDRMIPAANGRIQCPFGNVFFGFLTGLTAGFAA